MTSIQTIVVEPGTPELAICARWRAAAFSVLQASFEEELRSLELFTSDQTHGVALLAKVDGEPIGMCLLVGSEIEPTMMCRHGWQACSLSRSVGERVQAPHWFEPSKIKRDSAGFRGSTSTPQMLSGSMRGSVGRSLIALTGGA